MSLGGLTFPMTRVKVRLEVLSPTVVTEGVLTNQGFEVALLLQADRTDRRC